MCIFGRLPSNWKNTHHPYVSYAYPTGCNRESYEVATTSFLFMIKQIHRKLIMWFFIIHKTKYILNYILSVTKGKCNVSKPREI